LSKNKNVKVGKQTGSDS